MLGAIIGSVVGFVGSVVSTVGVGICNLAKGVISVMEKIGPRIDQVISCVAKIIHAVVECLGIQTEESPEVLGAKAAQSDKSIEDFDNNVEDYIKYFKEKIEFDKEKFNNMNPEEKLGCKAIGMVLETKAVEEKIGGIKIPPESLGLLAKIQLAGVNIEAKELVNLVLALKEEGVVDMNDVVEYLEGKGYSNRLKTGQILRSILGENADKVYQWQDAVREYEKEDAFQ